MQRKEKLHLKLHSLSTALEMASRGCLRSADAFCYVCGHFIKTRARKYSVKACRKMCEAYKAYFGMPVGDQDKSWAPHVICEYCKKTLEGWYRGEKRAMKFAIPRIWREPTDHSNNCYFCMVEPTKRRTGKNAPQIVYPDLPSSIAPVPHCPQLPVPTPPTRDRSSSGDNSKSDSEEDTGDLECDFTDADDEKRPYFPNQKDINDLIRDLGLTKSNAELLTSRLKQWNLLDESVQIDDQEDRSRQNNLRLRGIPEATTADDLETSVIAIFSTVLGTQPSSPIVIDRVHRAIGRRSSDPSWPRDVICQIFPGMCSVAAVKRGGRESRGRDVPVP
ncbi:uncharacterized protein ACMZJ9_011741 [Mantella aurantiaca]